MKKPLRRTAAALLTSFAIVTGGCTYSGELENSFYTPSARTDLEGGKIPLSIAVVNSAAFKKTTFKAAAGGHGVEIPVGEPTAKALQAELAGIFLKASIVDDARATDSDLYVYPKLKWVETRRTASAHLRYKVSFLATIKSEKEDYTIIEHMVEKEVDYSPPDAAVGAQTLMLTSLFLLAPLTVPVTTQSVGAKAKELVGQTISDLVHEFGDTLAKKRVVREYAALIAAGGVAKPAHHAVTVSTTSSPGPGKRALSKYDDLLNAVVVVRTAKAFGSGFFVSGDGLIVTNGHVVENENTVAVQTRDGGVGLGRVIARSDLKDLALIRLSGKGFNHLRLSNGAHAGIGNEVLAIGTPRGLDWSVSRGIVSAVRPIKHVRLIQTDAAINNGNSGGPLIDLASGFVVGVNTMGYPKYIAEGLNFAVSSEDVLMTFKQYLKP